MTYKVGQDIKLYKNVRNVKTKQKIERKVTAAFSFLHGHHGVDPDQDIMDHVQAHFDSMSKEQFLQMVNYDPKLDPVLNEAIKIWDAKLFQLQQPQVHQIQQPAKQYPQIQVQQPAQEQQQIPIPENLNSENDSDSDSGWDDPVDLVLPLKET